MVSVRAVCLFMGWWAFWPLSLAILGSLPDQYQSQKFFLMALSCITFLCFPLSPFVMPDFPIAPLLFILFVLGLTVLPIGLALHLYSKKKCTNKVVLVSTQMTFVAKGFTGISLACILIMVLAKINMLEFDL